jgi:hypothetical protein
MEMRVRMRRADSFMASGRWGDSFCKAIAQMPG